MKIKVLASCSGMWFSYAPEQEVENIDPVVGADLVKHGLAIELESSAETAIPSETDPAETATASNPKGVETGNQTDPDAETAKVSTDPADTAKTVTKKPKGSKGSKKS
jgi:hypothetical protein